MREVLSKQLKRKPTQGLADVFYLMDYIFTSNEAKKLNKDIFETIYYAAIYESNILCMDGKYERYTHFEGSPMSNGIFQFDMWGLDSTQLSGMWDWDKLKKSVSDYGVCNSLYCLVIITFIFYLLKSTTVFLNYQVPPNSSFKYCSFSQSLYIEHSSISKSSSISLGKPVSISN